MEAQFFCTGCGSEHNDPADARLGHLVICLYCACVLEFEDCLANDTVAFVAPVAA